MKISVIIPTLNEESNIVKLVRYLRENGKGKEVEILVADGGSTDFTEKEAEVAGAVVVDCPERGRSKQMNYVAAMSTGDILYFVHAATLPPDSYVNDILAKVGAGIPLGCYRFKFDSQRFMLKINSYFTRFDGMMCRGGDQTLYVTREVFNELGGYDEDFRVMEEYDFLKRARKKYPFKILPKNVLVSARKYEGNSWLKVNLANLITFAMYRCGCSKDCLIKTYYRLLRQPTYQP